MATFEWVCLSSVPFSRSSLVGLKEGNWLEDRLSLNWLVTHNRCGSWVPLPGILCWETGELLELLMDAAVRIHMWSSVAVMCRLNLQRQLMGKQRKKWQPRRKPWEALVSPFKFLGFVPTKLGLHFGSCVQMSIRFAKFSYFKNSPLPELELNAIRWALNNIFLEIY